MPILSNPRHEAFCQYRSQGKSKFESYKLAGYKQTKTSRQNAFQLATKPYILARLEELGGVRQEHFEITVEAIAANLLEDRLHALKLGHSSAMVAADVALAKLGGLMVERATVQVTHNYAMMSEEELRFELAAINAEARAIKPGMNH